MEHHRSRDRATRRLPGTRAFRFLTAVALLTGVTIPEARAQSYMARGPSVGTVSVGPRAVGPGLNMGPGMNPNVRYSPNLNTDVGSYADGPERTGSYGAYSDQSGGSSRRVRRNTATPPADTHYISREVVIEVDGTPTDAEADVIARRHRLTRVQSQSFPLIGSTMYRWRIPDDRSVSAVVRELVADNTIKSAQPNFRYTLQQATQPTAVAAPAEGDPAQYALAKLRLPEAHTLAHGDNVTVAVIDSGIDANHPELMGAIGDTFDALGSKEGPHVHGTGVASIIAAHARLMGSSPSATILAIRAFGATDGGAESTSFVVLKSLDFAVKHNARVINMSFAGPEDPLLGKGLAAAAAKGVVLVAPSGNAGPKSPPLFPAADRNVIAVTATDAADKLFPASNRGGYVAIAAPGVDILMAAPDQKYQVKSGTSFATAYISGLAALMIERNPAITPAEVRAVLTKTAHDLGAPGRDDLFGAGEADAFAAVSAAGVPVAVSQQPSTTAGDPIQR